MKEVRAYHVFVQEREKGKEDGGVDQAQFSSHVKEEPCVMEIIYVSRWSIRAKTFLGYPKFMHGG